MGVTRIQQYRNYMIPKYEIAFLRNAFNSDIYF